MSSRLPALLTAVLVCVAASEAEALTVRNRRVQPGQTVARALEEAGVEGAQGEALVAALSGVFDCRKSNVGDQLRLVMSDGVVERFDYRKGPLDEFQVRRDGDRFVAHKREVEFEKATATVELRVSGSLYEAAQGAGEDPVIALLLADVFAWDIDFYRDVQRNDVVRVVVEKVLSKGRLIRYGEVLGADYAGSSVGHKRVYRYVMPDGTASFFQEDGASARKSFLKSPLKFAHVTSGFGSRLHPVLQYVKAHNGVDYGAPPGTPVWAVADGTVVKAQYDAAAGNHVCIRHRSEWETCYLHLSKFGEGVRVGARVSQKQVVAYSGNTGRSTGPHLHYALKRAGAFVNPLNQNFPRAEPVPAALLADFRAKTADVGVSLGQRRVAALPE